MKRLSGIHSPKLAAPMLTAVAVGCVAGIVIGMITSPPDALFYAGFIAYPVVGALILAKLPGHSIGRLMVGVGAGWAVSAVGDAAASRVADPTADAWLGLMQSMGILVGWIFPLLIFVLYPSPTMETRGQRALVRIIGAVAVTGGLADAISSRPSEADLPVSPLAVEALAAPAAAAQSAVWTLYQATLLVSLVYMAVRMRRSTGVERLQYRWFVAGVLVLVLAFVFGSIQGATPRLLVVASLSAPPVAMGIAIVRFRLYEIDRLISRSISYAVVSGVVLGTYALVVAMVSRLLPESGALAVAGATLTAAAAFRPVLRRVQGVVDRRFNRAKYDAALEVDAFAARLRDSVDPQTASADLVAVVHRTVEPDAVGVWVVGAR